MSSQHNPTTSRSDINQKEHKEASPAMKKKKTKSELPVSKETERIIQETTKKRRKAIKELANR